MEKSLSSLQKSLLVPGWGQLAEKRIFEGVFFLGSEIFCFYKFFNQNHKGNYYYEKYKNAAGLEEAVRFRELTEKHDTLRNKFLLAAAGIWVLNLVDIFLIVKSREGDEKEFSIRFFHGGQKDISLRFSYRF
ncbi:MAG: hypothetical protein JXB26_05280 [Candidatus Aminicenantes bacterium]|nr:hypothetical protein [Candidatus Aminicenantes bacterium]